MKIRLLSFFKNLFKLCINKIHRFVNFIAEFWQGFFYGMWNIELVKRSLLVKFFLHYASYSIIVLSTGKTVCITRSHSKNSMQFNQPLKDSEKEEIDYILNNVGV